jgi:hypothetical protein
MTDAPNSQAPDAPLLSKSASWAEIRTRIEARGNDERLLHYWFDAGWDARQPEIDAAARWVDAAMAALRAAKELVDDLLPYAMDAWDWKYGKGWRKEAQEITDAIVRYDKAHPIDANEEARRQSRPDDAT